MAVVGKDYSAKNSDVGTRLFTQLFTTLPDFEDLNKFEENVKLTFDSIISYFKGWYLNNIEEFIDQNLLFTILACFNTSDSYVVKVFGDGYIITQNLLDNISYIKLNYGKYAPYFAYKYYLSDIKSYFENRNFKTFTFSKKYFKNVGIATDGIAPIVKGEMEDFDKLLLSQDKKNTCLLKMHSIRTIFYDDISLGIFDNGGALNG